MISSTRGEEGREGEEEECKKETERERKSREDREENVGGWGCGDDDGDHDVVSEPLQLFWAAVRSMTGPASCEATASTEAMKLRDYITSDRLYNRRNEMGDPFEVLEWLLHIWDEIGVYRQPELFCLFAESLFQEKVVHFCPQGHTTGVPVDVRVLHLGHVAGLRVAETLEQLISNKRQCHWTGDKAGARCDAGCQSDEKQPVYEYLEFRNPPCTLVIRITKSHPFVTCPFGRNVRFALLRGEEGRTPPYRFVAAILYRPGHYLAIGVGSDGKLREHDSKPASGTSAVREVEVGQLEGKVVGLFYVLEGAACRPKAGLRIAGLLWDQNNCYVSALLTCASYVCMWAGVDFRDRE